MQPIDLVEFEQIKQLKARYFRLLDTRQWDAWEDVFTEDVVGNFQTVNQFTSFTGRQALVDGVKKFLVGSAFTVHHGHMPELEMTGPDTARGIWSMRDIVRKAETTLYGYGHYEEEYLKQDGTWRIKTIRLTRLHTDLRSNAAT